MLTKAQLDGFYDTGYVALRGAMPRQKALDFGEDVLGTAGLICPRRYNDLGATSRSHMPSLSSQLVAEFAPSVLEAMGQLCGGLDRIAGEPRWGDSFIVNLGADDH
ncbi:MAG: hypothetical protein QM758_27185 [Armatimonas sp.]